jgi:solute:Na+ symporter, SSS family
LCVVARGYHGVIGIQSAGGVVCAVGLLFLAFNGYSPAGSLLAPALSGAGIPWAIVLPGLAVPGVWWLCIDQFAVHRTFVARSSAAARRGSGIAAGLILLGIAAVAAGFGRAVSPAGQGSAVNTVTAGFLGAAIISFGVASLSGYFMSVATLFTADIFLSQRKKCDEVALVMVGRLTNTAAALLAILAASSVAFMGAGSIEWMVRAHVATVPPVVAVTTIGLFWPRMHGRGASWALGAGWLAGLIQAVVSPVGIVGAMQVALLTFCCSALVLVAVSLASAPLGKLGTLPEVSLEEGLGVRRT